MTDPDTANAIQGLSARLQRAEADRDRMMSALQLARDAIIAGERVARERGQEPQVKRRTRQLIDRALSRIQPVRPLVDDGASA